MNNFYQEFKENINREALIRGTSQEEVFFSNVKDLLIDANEINEAINCHFERPTSGSKLGIQIDGYGGNPIDSQNTLTIFLVDFSFSDEIEIINKNELIRTLKKGANFINQIESSNFRNSLEESSEEFRITDQLYRQLDSISRYEIYLLTNKEERTRIKEHDVTARGELCRISVIDIKKIKELEEGKDIQEDTIMDNLAIPVLTADFDNEDYRSYLAVLDGDFLANIYEEYGHRLLEKNVRVFLGTSRKINAGIQKTIQNEPEMFFAYNNGITATAEDITTQVTTGGRVITSLKNLQIVNGGQTTSSIYYAFKKNIDISKIKVQMKLSVIEKQEKIDKIIPEISRCANTQNKVDSADFSSNHKFHTTIEKKSRFRSYKPQGQSFTNTKWFYERTRGSYNETRNKKIDRQQKRIFDAEYPKKQMFVKTDLAAYLNSWDQKPYLVSLGPQKNFLIFNDQIQKEYKDNPKQFDDYYFDLIIGKKILYDCIYSITNKKNGIYSSYRQVVTYTMAKLSYDLPKGYELNFKKIAEDQTLDDNIKSNLLNNVLLIYKIINSPVAFISGIETEYTKKIPNENTPKDEYKNYCWERVKDEDCSWECITEKYLISKNDQRNLIAKKQAQQNKKVDDSVEEFRKLLLVNSKGWKELLDFCEENYLSIEGSDTYLLKNCRGIGTSRFMPNDRQISRLRWIYNLAKEEGFSSINFPKDY